MTFRGSGVTTQPARDAVAQRLTELQKLSDEATPGPWKRNGNNGIHTERGECVALSHGDAQAQRGTDAHFIAAAREGVPWLVGQVRELTEQVGYERGVFGDAIKAMQSERDGLLALVGELTEQARVNGILADSALAERDEARAALQRVRELRNNAKRLVHGQTHRRLCYIIDSERLDAALGDDPLRVWA